MGQLFRLEDFYRVQHLTGHAARLKQSSTDSAACSGVVGESLTQFAKPKSVLAFGGDDEPPHGGPPGARLVSHNLFQRL